MAYVTDLFVAHAMSSVQPSMQGSSFVRKCPRFLLMYEHLVSSTTGLCLELSFERSLYSEQPWNIELVIPLKQ